MGIFPTNVSPGPVIDIDANVDAIKAVTDLIPDAGAMTSIAQEATLEEVEEEVERVDEHFHNLERWWGAVAVPDETNAIAATVTVDFQATSGNDTWGIAIPILGTADDPTPNGQLLFDPHRVIFTDLDDDTSLWRFRIIYGYGTSGDAITANQWTEIPVISNAVPGNRAGGSAEDAKMIVLLVGIKLWAQSWNATNGEVLDFQWGAHGYPAPSAPTPP